MSAEALGQGDGRLIHQRGEGGEQVFCICAITGSTTPGPYPVLLLPAMKSRYSTPSTSVVQP
jgi:hypothetical protein